MGFATGIETYGESTVPAASVRRAVMRMLAEERAAAPAVNAHEVAAEVADSLRALLKEQPPVENRTYKFIEALTRQGGTK